MFHRHQERVRILNILMASLPLDMRDETNATRIVLVLRMI